MRLGKTRNWAAAGRKLFGQPSERADGALATEERNALLGVDSGPPGSEFPASEEDTMLAGDPTQHLLTALGRFHRQVVKAKSAASQDEWCEECMNQILSGIEIALSQNWEDVQEALTDAARILLSYEEAGCAQGCVSFLQDGYEILCLMVGDLIVDNVRSGVMDKWRRRYQVAIEELLKAGLTLVEDEEDEAPESTGLSSSGEPLSYPQPAIQSDEIWDEDPFGEVLDELPVETAEAPPVESEDLSMLGQELGEAHPDIVFEEESHEDMDDTPFPESVLEALSKGVQEEAGDTAPFDDPETSGTIIPALEEDFEFGAVTTIAAAHQSDDQTEWPEEFQAEAEEIQDALAEDSSPVDADTMAYGEEENDGAELETDQVAAEPELNFSPVAESPLAEVLEEQDVPEPEVVESVPQPPVEMTFDFETPAAEVPAPAPVEPAAFSADEELSAIIASLSAEAAQAAKKLTEVEEPVQVIAEPVAPEPAPPVAAPVQAAPVAAALTGKAAEAEERFRDTHDAMLRGDVGDAKLLALNLAADMAQLEVDRSETQVRNRQTRIEVDEHGIAAESEEVHNVEKALRDTEWHVGELQAEFMPKREHVNALRGQVSTIDNGITDIEAQIRELEARRDQEIRRKSDTEGELDAALAEESRIQSALDNLAEVERSTREQLDTHSKELERRKDERDTHQADLDVAVEELAARRNSMREIRRMFELLGGK